MTQEIQAYPKQIMVNGQPVVANDPEHEKELKRTDSHKPKASGNGGPVEIGRADGTVDVVKPDDKQGGDTKPATEQVKAARENK